MPRIDGSLLVPCWRNPVGEEELHGTIPEIFFSGWALQRVVRRYHEGKRHQSIMDVFVQLCQPQRCICWKYGLASMDWVHPSIFQWVTPFTSHQNQTLNFFWCGFAWGGAVSSFSVQLLLRFMFEYRHHFSSAVTTVLSLSKRSFLGINVVQAPMSYQQSRSVYVRPMSPICWYCPFPPSDAKIAV